MNLIKFVPNSLSLKVGRTILLTQKNSPTILFGVGIVGVVATVVLASRATLRLEETIDVTNENLETAKRLHSAGNEKYSDQAYKKDVAIQYVRSVGSVAKLYGPSVLVGVASIGCLVGSHGILSKRNAGLMTAYSVLQKGFDEYRARVIEEIGPEKERELRYGSETREIVEDTDKGPKVSQITTVGPNGESIYARFFNKETSPQHWSPDPMYNRTVLRADQGFANDLLHSKGHIFLNEVYDALGLERSSAGAVVGWVLDGEGDNYVDFGFGPDEYSNRDFFYGRDGSILLDFNVNGEIYKLLDEMKKRKN